MTNFDTVSIVDSNYDEARVKLRYGLFLSGIFLFISTVGLSTFTYQYHFGKVSSLTISPADKDRVVTY